MPANLIRQYRSPIPVMRRAFDAGIIFGSLYASQWLVGQPLNDRTAATALMAVLIYWVIGEISGIFFRDQGAAPSRELIGVAGTWWAGVLILSVVAFFTRHGDDFARSSILGWIVLTASALGLVRMLFRVALTQLSLHGVAVKRCAIAGLNTLGRNLADNARNNPSAGLQVIGFFDDRSPARRDGEPLPPEPMLGGLNDLIARAKAGEIDTVFITLPMRAEQRIKQLLESLGDTTASVYIVPDFFVFELLHSRWTQVGGLPTVSVFESPLYGVDGWIKRLFDVTSASLGLVLISPIMFTCALLVRLSSPGPIFFRQRRYGLDGKEIWVWKFRSMRTCDNGPVVQQATKEDPRITPIGRILRKTSLDELPQLFNVIEGTMSLVGPRPHASAHNEHYRKLVRGYMLRHKVKPGITGLAQVEGYRGETETLDKMQKRVECDHRYIREWSLGLDIKILAKTFFVVFKQENAY